MRCFNILVGVNRKAVLGGRNAGEIFIAQSGTRVVEKEENSKEETRITQRPRIHRAECLVDASPSSPCPPFVACLPFSRSRSFLVEELSAPVVEERKKKKRKERNRDSVESAWKFMTWRVYSHWFTRGLILVFPFVSHAFREARRWFHTLSLPLFLFRSVSLLCRLSLDDGEEYCRRNFEACRHLLLSSAFGDTCNYELPIVVSRPR